ncbi:hypothetical protein Sru01_56750 [Sphaerisporangium rufum]|uniref:Uncharacterized protein n=1 Tax=Sphaerisporangium rufum TaxID=1381558 RepID=A0A919R7M8_9ACTN|nr:class I SAM-dependent methyltransferase [Sphaerisporangium rufum]GII80693.1 hypothetical protein Sru01_56750 [Sphaerisporangium rufum]
MPSPRVLAAAAAAGAALAVALLAWTVAAGALAPAAAAQLALSVLILAATVVAVAVTRRADGKALRVDARTKRQEAALRRTGEEISRLAATVDGLAGRLEEAGHRRAEVVLAALGEDRMELAAQAERLDRLDAELHAGRAELRAGRAELAATVRQNYAQLEALVDLRALLRPRAPLPALRGWAASPDMLRLLVGRIAAGGVKTVVECGSGSSSVWLGYAVERFGGGRVVALEHDERFARATRDLVLAHGLQDVVEVRHAPLLPWSGGRDGDDGDAVAVPWYDPAALADLPEVDLVFVDGPPGATAPLVRYPAVPVLLPHCTADAWIVLDDADRPAEREVAERWLREYPELAGTAHRAEKGAMVLRRTP